eukprot:TRINITY_DN14742_c0_g1_i1.p1 TRINITY_DN14742_c0_g1~~TRINITY_DN14742_c0_g1_i1.p1  ORF type:complete len:2010 (+),score=319.09 TRINITY_DN14742_c0_g1_i1:625-6654(+)
MCSAAAGYNTITFTPPTVAVVTYWAHCTRLIGTDSIKRDILVLDCGHRFTSAAMVRTSTGDIGELKMEVLASRGIRLGGYDLDIALSSNISTARGNVSDSQIIGAAEKAKKELSSLKETSLQVKEFKKLINHKDLAIAGEVLHCCTKEIIRAVTSGTPTLAILVGGGSRSTIIQSYIKETFGLPVETLDCDYATVMGTAIAASGDITVEIKGSGSPFQYWACTFDPDSVIPLFENSSIEYLDFEGYMVFQRQRTSYAQGNPSHSELVDCSRMPTHDPRSARAKTDGTVDELGENGEGISQNSPNLAIPHQPVDFTKELVIRRYPEDLNQQLGIRFQKYENKIHIAMIRPGTLAENQRAHTAIGWIVSHCNLQPVFDVAQILRISGGQLETKLTLRAPADHAFASGIQFIGYCDNVTKLTLQPSGLVTGVLPQRPPVMDDRRVDETQYLLALEKERTAQTKSLGEARNDLDEVIIRSNDEFHPSVLNRYFKGADDLVRLAATLLEGNQVIHKKRRKNRLVVAKMRTLGKLLLKILDFQELSKPVPLAAGPQGKLDELIVDYDKACLMLQDYNSDDADDPIEIDKPFLKSTRKRTGTMSRLNRSNTVLGMGRRGSRAGSGSPAKKKNHPPGLEGFGSFRFNKKGSPAHSPRHSPKMDPVASPLVKPGSPMGPRSQLSRSVNKAMDLRRAGSVSGRRKSLSRNFNNSTCQSEADGSVEFEYGEFPGVTCYNSESDDDNDRNVLRALTSSLIKPDKPQGLDSSREGMDVVSPTDVSPTVVPQAIKDWADGSPTMLGSRRRSNTFAARRMSLPLSPPLENAGPGPRTDRRSSVFDVAAASPPPRRPSMPSLTPPLNQLSSRRLSQQSGEGSKSPGTSKSPIKPPLHPFPNVTSPPQASIQPLNASLKTKKSSSSLSASSRSDPNSRRPSDAALGIISPIEAPQRTFPAVKFADPSRGDDFVLSDDDSIINDINDVSNSSSLKTSSSLKQSSDGTLLGIIKNTSDVSEAKASSLKQQNTEGNLSPKSDSSSKPKQSEDQKRSESSSSLKRNTSPRKLSAGTDQPAANRSTSTSPRKQNTETDQSAVAKKTAASTSPRKLSAGIDQAGASRNTSTSPRKSSTEADQSVKKPPVPSTSPRRLSAGVDQPAAVSKNSSTSPRKLSTGTDQTANKGVATSPRKAAPKKTESEPTPTTAVASQGDVNKPAPRKVSTSTTPTRSKSEGGTSPRPSVAPRSPKAGTSPRKPEQTATTESKQKPESLESTKADDPNDTPAESSEPAISKTHNTPSESPSNRRLVSPKVPRVAMLSSPKRNDLSKNTTAAATTAKRSSSPKIPSCAVRVSPKNLALSPTAGNRMSSPKATTGRTTSPKSGEKTTTLCTTIDANNRVRMTTPKPEPLDSSERSQSQSAPEITRVVSPKVDSRRSSSPKSALVVRTAARSFSPKVSDEQTAKQKSVSPTKATSRSGSPIPVRSTLSGMSDKKERSSSPKAALPRRSASPSLMSPAKRQSKPPSKVDITNRANTSPHGKPVGPGFNSSAPVIRSKPVTGTPVGTPTASDSNNLSKTVPAGLRTTTTQKSKMVPRVADLVHPSHKKPSESPVHSPTETELTDDQKSLKTRRPTHDALEAIQRAAERSAASRRAREEEDRINNITPAQLQKQKSMQAKKRLNQQHHSGIPSYDEVSGEFDDGVQGTVSSLALSEATCSQEEPFTKTVPLPNRVPMTIKEKRHSTHHLQKSKSSNTSSAICSPRKGSQPLAFSGESAPSIVNTSGSQVGGQMLITSPLRHSIDLEGMVNVHSEGNTTEEHPRPVPPRSVGFSQSTPCFDSAVRQRQPEHHGDGIGDVVKSQPIHRRVRGTDTSHSRSMVELTGAARRSLTSTTGNVPRPRSERSSFSSTVRCNLSKKKKPSRLRSNTVIDPPMFSSQWPPERKRTPELSPRKKSCPSPTRRQRPEQGFSFSAPTIARIGDEEDAERETALKSLRAQLQNAGIRGSFPAPRQQTASSAEARLRSSLKKGGT